MLMFFDSLRVNLDLYDEQGTLGHSYMVRDEGATLISVRVVQNLLSASLLGLEIEESDENQE